MKIAPTKSLNLHKACVNNISLNFLTSLGELDTLKELTSIKVSDIRLTVTPRDLTRVAHNPVAVGSSTTRPTEKKYLLQQILDRPMLFLSQFSS